MAANLGNTLRTARRVAITERPRAFRGVVTTQDKVEFYRLSLSRRSRFDLSLTGLRANANVDLLNQRGRVINKSRLTGTQNESITSVLAAGTYYVRVNLQGRGSTRFRLVLSARLIPPGNTAPTLITNTGLTVSARGTAPIRNTLLRATDSQQPATQLVYTLTGLPQSGQLQLNGVPLALGSRFTQADIESDRLRYVNLGTTRQLTNNTTDDFAAGISSSHVVWNGSDGDSEVYLYTIATGQITLLTNNTTDDIASGVSGGNVLFANNFRNFFYNGITGITRTILSNMTIFPDFELSFPVGISGSNIVWNSSDGSDLEVMFFNGTTNTRTRLTNNTGNDAATGISGSNVVFTSNLDNQGLTTTASEVFLYEGATNRLFPLTNNNRKDSAVGISDSNVVWNSFDGNDYEIFFYNGSTGVTTQLTNNAIDDVAPIGGISGSNVVWNSLVNNSRSEVFLFNGTSSRRISSDNVNAIAFGISGSNVIMNSLNDSTQQFGDVFFYNGATGVTSQITNDNVQDGAVGISGTNFVWNRSDGTDSEVFLLTFAPTDRFSFSVTDGFDGFANGTFNISIS
ncbi:MAG: cadherin-like domain-containing protein [Oculatellaceae cyanobacterium bins.114]|nr:cadherin-like domain-containing protein [Oculatellaceae cyanobacterium bins.114]